MKAGNGAEILKSLQEGTDGGGETEDEADIELEYKKSELARGRKAEKKTRKGLA